MTQSRQMFNAADPLDDVKHVDEAERISHLLATAALNDDGRARAVAQAVVVAHLQHAHPRQRPGSPARCSGSARSGGLVLQKNGTNFAQVSTTSVQRLIVVILRRQKVKKEGHPT